MSCIPRRAGETPIIVDLEPGTEYLYCRCGHSTQQPWCDGSHTALGDETTLHHDPNCQPLQFQVTKRKRCWLCTCKAAPGPYCDGSHARPSTDPPTADTTTTQAE